MRYNGTNSYVSVPHNAALNAFPLTITAWVKTLRNSDDLVGMLDPCSPLHKETHFQYQDCCQDDTDAKRKPEHPA